MAEYRHWREELRGELGAILDRYTPDAYPAGIDTQHDYDLSLFHVDERIRQRMTDFHAGERSIAEANGIDLAALDNRQENERRRFDDALDHVTRALDERFDFQARELSREIHGNRSTRGEGASARDRVDWEP